MNRWLGKGAGFESEMREVKRDGGGEGKRVGGRGGGVGA